MIRTLHLRLGFVTFEKIWNEGDASLSSAK